MLFSDDKRCFYIVLGFNLTSTNTQTTWLKREKYIEWVNFCDMKNSEMVSENVLFYWILLKSFSDFVQKQIKKELNLPHDE